MNTLPPDGAESGVLRVQDGAKFWVVCPVTILKIVQQAGHVEIHWRRKK